MKTLTENAKKFLPLSNKVVMNPAGYAKLRSLPRQEMNIESTAMLWKAGLMARIGDTEVYVDATVDEKEVLFFLKDGSTMVTTVAEVVTGPCSECGA